VFVEGNAVGEPPCARGGADEHEQRPSVDSGTVVGLIVLDEDRVEAAIADEFPRFGVGEHGHAGMIHELVDEVT
jgi:hypothetical protein